jgi:hypothetical protein
MLVSLAVASLWNMLVSADEPQAERVRTRTMPTTSLTRRVCHTSRRVAAGT